MVREELRKMKLKCLIITLMMLLMISIVNGLSDCEGTMHKGDLPCLIISSWQFDCSTETIQIYNEVPTLLRTAQLVDYGNSGRCNISFGIADNETALGSYLLNWSSGDSAKIIIEEDNNMLIALVIGVVFIVALFIVLTLSTKEDKPFLANFFFLGIFIFTTVLSNLLWKITNINSAPYEPIMYIVYYMFLVITMVMMFVILIMLTVEAVKIRKIAGNPVDNYRDNLNEKNQF